MPFLVSRFSFLVSRFSFLVSRWRCDRSVRFLVSRFSFLGGCMTGPLVIQFYAFVCCVVRQQRSFRLLPDWLETSFNGTADFSDTDKDGEKEEEKNGLRSVERRDCSLHGHFIQVSILASNTFIVQMNSC